jgi:hypothetical protein
MLTTIPLGVIDSAGSRVYAKWSSLNKSSFITLSTDKLSTSSVVGQYGSIISDIGIAPGDTGYFELTPTVASPTGGGPFMGMGNFIPISGASTQQVGNISNSFAFRGNAGTIGPGTACIQTKFGSSASTYVGINTCTISVGANCIVTITNHNYYTGMPFRLTTTGVLPGGLGTNTTYYVHVIDNNTFNIAATLANSVAGPYITTLYSGSGVITVRPVGDCTSNVVSTDVFSFVINNTTGKANIYKASLAGVSQKVFIDFYVPLGSTWYPCVSGDGRGSGVTANFGQNAWDARTASLRSTLETAGYKIGIYN